LGRWFKKLRRKKKALSEGPEEFAGFGYESSYCIGPFIIFRDDNDDAMYLFSKRGSKKTFENHEPIAYVESETHGELISSSRSETLTNDRNDKSIHGRIWVIDKQTYIAFWSNYEQIKSFGLGDCVNQIKDLLSYFLHENIENVLFNPYQESETSYNATDKTYTYEEFASGRLGSSKNSHQQLNKDLHLMSPEKKSEYLKAMGIKPKTTLTPDFLYRQLTGIDETKHFSKKNI
jgi:hypothetical protein